MDRAFSLPSETDGSGGVLVEPDFGQDHVRNQIRMDFILVPTQGALAHVVPAGLDRNLDIFEGAFGTFVLVVAGDEHVIGHTHLERGRAVFVEARDVKGPVVTFDLSDSHKVPPPI